MNNIPNEILAMILKFVLPHPSAIITIKLTCWRWHNVLLGIPQANFNVFNDFIYINRLINYIRKESKSALLDIMHQDICNICEKHGFKEPQINLTKHYSMHVSFIRGNNIIKYVIWYHGRYSNIRINNDIIYSGPNEWIYGIHQYNKNKLQRLMDALISYLKTHNISILNNLS